MTGRDIEEKLNYIGMERGIRRLAVKENFPEGREVTLPFSYAKLRPYGGSGMLEPEEKGQDCRKGVFV